MLCTCDFGCVVHPLLSLVYPQMVVLEFCGHYGMDTIAVPVPLKCKMLLEGFNFLLVFIVNEPMQKAAVVLQYTWYGCYCYLLRI